MNLFELLKTLNIPVAYDHFKEDLNNNVQPPFILYREIQPNTFKADNITYVMSKSYEIDLVTDYKDIELEDKIEKLFSDNQLAFDKYGDVFIDSEQIYQITYEI